ncbi:MAG: adenine deaminase, partial [Dehalococcoidia bacterium]|nr:adenine deaminase [Dehalococcoidia bacterium]
MELEQLIAVARGERGADLLLTNAKTVNTLTAEIEDGNVAVFGDRIAGVGSYDKARQVIDLDGAYVVPGLIDGHTHIESSLLHPSEYARAVVPRGISAIITDLHEIANVSGLAGVRFVMEIARTLPMDFHFMAPSCVPATHLETAGAALGPDELRPSLRWRDIIGLGEMMNFPGVLSRQPDIMRKLALFKGRPIDGHAPSLSGKDLNAYIAAGAGSDHESTSFAEGREKLRRGMYLMIREGSSEKNLDDLLP